MTKRILIAPLDWGLGHATRCIPVIRELAGRGCEVMLAGAGSSLDLLREEFPAFKAFSLPAYNPRYSRKRAMVASMIMQLPHFIRTIKSEHRAINKLVEDHKIDIVISDNRFGCHSDMAYSVFVTHQSNILMPKRFGWLGGIVRYLNIHQMGKFDECWVPDFGGEKNITGALMGFGRSDDFHKKVRWIGPLSRFTFTQPAETVYDILVICSGPEPQRSLLEEMLINQLKQSSYRFLLVRGVISPGEYETGNGTVVNFLKSSELERAIMQASMVIARSGYSTVMDMQVMGKKVIFIPTPGQTEQEYLAKRLHHENIAYASEQESFNLADALSESRRFTGFLPAHLSKGDFRKTINELLDERIS